MPTDERLRFVTVGASNDVVRALARHSLTAEPWADGCPLPEGEAFVLILGPAASADLSVECLGRLQASGRPFGVIPWTSPKAGRAWLAKILGPPRTSIRPDHILFSYGEGEPSHVLSRRPCVRLAGEPDNAALSPMEADALWLSGHSNQFDGYFGPGLLLCGRDGSAATGAMYPCRTTGTCFREAASQPSQRLRVADLSARLLVLSGCNTLPVLPGWASPAFSLLDQMASGPAQAVVCTLGVVSVSVQADLVMLGVLAKGGSLHEAVAAANEIREGFRRHAGLPRSARPLVLVGNPLATADFGAALPGGRTLLLGGVRLGEVHSVAAEAAGEAGDADTIVVRTGQTGFLWRLPSRIGGGQPDGAEPVRQAFDEDPPPRLPASAAILSNWIETIGWIERVINGAEPMATRLIEARERFVELVLNSLLEGKTPPMEVEQAVAAATRLASESMSMRSTRILNQWSNRWEVVEVDGEAADRCRCGGRLYQSLFGRPGQTARRRLASCAVCGPVSDCAVGPEGEGAATFPPRLDRGDRQTVLYPLPMSARGAPAAFAIIQVLQSACAASSRPVIGPNATGETAAVEVPADLPAGVYPVALVWGDLSGLSVRRDMMLLNVEVATPGEPTGRPVEVPTSSLY